MRHPQTLSSSNAGDDDGSSSSQFARLLGQLRAFISRHKGRLTSTFIVGAIFAGLVVGLIALTPTPTPDWLKQVSAGTALILLSTAWFFPLRSQHDNRTQFSITPAGANLVAVQTVEIEEVPTGRKSRKWFYGVIILVLSLYATVAIEYVQWAREDPGSIDQDSRIGLYLRDAQDKPSIQFREIPNLYYRILSNNSTDGELSLKYAIPERDDKPIFVVRLPPQTSQVSARIAKCPDQGGTYRAAALTSRLDPVAQQYVAAVPLVIGDDEGSQSPTPVDCDGTQRLLMEFHVDGGIQRNVSSNTREVVVAYDSLASYKPKDNLLPAEPLIALLGDQGFSTDAWLRIGIELPSTKDSFSSTAPSPVAASSTARFWLVKSGIGIVSATWVVASSFRLEDLVPTIVLLVVGALIGWVLSGLGRVPAPRLTLDARVQSPISDPVDQEPSKESAAPTTDPTDE